MNTLIGTWVACSLSFWSYNPDIKREVRITTDSAVCQVIDDRFMPVGNPDHWEYPLVVDCSKAIMWLKPLRGNGIFFLLKKDCKL